MTLGQPQHHTPSERVTGSNYAPIAPAEVARHRQRKLVELRQDQTFPERIGNTEAREIDGNCAPTLARD
jgi:hypothetical protein